MKTVETNELAAAVDRVEYLLMRGDSRSDVLDGVSALRKIINRCATAGNSAQPTRDAGADDFEDAAFKLHQRAETLRAGPYEQDVSFTSKCLRDLALGGDFFWRTPDRSEAAKLLREVWPQARRRVPLRQRSVLVPAASGERFEVVFLLNGRMQVRGNLQSPLGSQLIAESVAGYPWIPAECPHVASMRTQQQRLSTALNGSAA